MKHFTLISILAAAVVLAGLGMFAATASAQVSLLATQDNTLQFGAGLGPDVDITPRNDGLLIIKLDTAPNERKVYMQWDLSSVDFTATNVRLDVSSGQNNATVLNSSMDVYACSDLAACETWDETTLTWQNAPGNNLVPADPGHSEYPRDPFPGSTKVGSFSIVNPVEEGGTWTMSSTPELVAAVNADTNDTLTLMVAAGETDFPNGYGPFWASKDHASLAGPRLTIVPEPATSCLLGLGLVALLAGYRRRSR